MTGRSKMVDSSTEGPHCSGCNRNFPVKNELIVHQMTCTLPVRGASFFPFWRDRDNRQRTSVVSDDDKIALPDTQDSQQVNDNQCTRYMFSKLWLTQRLAITSTQLQSE